MLFLTTKVELATNAKLNSYTTNRLVVANTFFKLLVDEIGEVVEFGEPDADGCHWVASETHIVEVKVLLREEGE